MVKIIVKSCVIALLCAAGTCAIAGTDTAVGTEPKTASPAAVARYTQAIIDRMDTDKSGEVSRAEFMDFMGKEFDRLDVNHDGKLQKSEILNKEILTPSNGSHR
jgi:hypothetical protein